MRAKIVSILLWLAKWGLSSDPRISKARELIAAAELFKADGQRKRAWVLNNLITAFPTAKVRDLSLLIEHVIQGL